jgi:adenosylcobalamin-dependent ribonucleoside-triphosphate reductase
VFIDFSKVRPEGSPIGGMQNRPASGPVPVMQALQGMKEVRGKGWAPWMQTMVVDHHLASCVQVGGARRAARIATKYWKDPGVLEFIRLKTDHQSGGFAKYWSSNNSVTVDAEFWAEAHVEGTWAHTVFRAIAEESYATGEPGVLNVDRLHGNLDGVEAYADGDFATGGSYQLQEETRTLTKALYRAAMDMPYQFIVNPCGEIALFLLGGYCVIADVAPFHCDTLDEAVEAFKLAARALVRVNRMDSTYKRETARTNRIGVGFTGIHEFAWKFFGLTWAELLDENRAHDFWAFWRRVNREVTADVSAYARSLGMVVPHTIFTVKPSGTISSLFGLTQGAHGPNSREILRWVQFDKLAKMDTILDYEAKGYPVLLDVPGRPTVAIVGFPTRPLVRTLGIPEDRFVTADELPFPMHFEWVRLIERHYLGADHGNQVSYTAYFDRATMTVDDYAETLRTWMPQVRCISVLPNRTAELKVQYGYLPQEPISAEEYETLVAHIAATEEAFNASELECGKGGCPIA